MNTLSDIERLRARRRWLAVAYVAFIAFFSSSCAMAATDVTHNFLLVSFGSSALAALPLYIINVLVHWATRLVKPGASTVGIKQLVVSLVFFTPIEAALVLPAINLFVSGQVLRASAGTTAVPLEPPRYIRFKKSPSMSTSR